MRKHLTYANVVSTLCLFGLLGGGAIAASTAKKNSVTSKSVKNKTLIGKDVRDGSLGGADVLDGSLGGADVLDDSLTGSDVDESTLSLGLSPTPSGPAGGDLTASYPNPLIKSSAVKGATVLDGSLTGDDLGSNAIGSRELDWETAGSQSVSDSEEIVAGGTSQGNTATEVRAQCPAGSFAVGGGGYWEFPSGTLSGVRLLGAGVLAEGRNGGTQPQDLTAFAFCML